ncbi:MULTISPECIES: hypothetical protein [Niastella]|uniref:Secreted protein n=1 Tax=Niastella soli TaxID=2821487 RepID=A0ABS3YZB8_9BACT|nr:hypothetical protein [Niastella soli]MBO9203279.1 hypothetical protein [Niastella soli]
MKSAKIMLMSVAIFAAVGGALAFKAAKFNQKFCVGTANGVNTLVPTFSGQHVSAPSGTPILLYRTTKANGTPISAAADCVNLTTTTQNSTTIVEE